MQRPAMIRAIAPVFWLLLGITAAPAQTISQAPQLPLPSQGTDKIFVFRGTAPVYSVPLGDLPTLTPLPITGNSVVGNSTSSLAVPDALALPGCSAAGDALGWATNTGFICNSNISAMSVIVGSTAIDLGTTNGLLYDNGGLLGNLATAASGVLVTSSGGVPSVSTTLPNGLAMGTPTSLTLTHATGLPISTGVSGLGTGVATALASSATGSFLNGVIAASAQTYSFLAQTALGTYEWVHGPVVEASIAAFRSDTNPWPTRHLQDYDDSYFPSGGGDFELVATGQPLPGQTATPDNIGFYIIVDNAGNEYARTDSSAIHMANGGGGLQPNGPYPGNDSVGFAWAVNAANFARAGIKISTIIGDDGTYECAGLNENITGATISGDVLTIPAGFTGVIQPSMAIYLPGSPPTFAGTVVGYGTGMGGPGTYILSGATPGSPTIAALPACLDMPPLQELSLRGAAERNVTLIDPTNANIVMVKEEGSDDIKDLTIYGDESTAASYPALWVDTPGTAANRVYVVFGSPACVIDQIAQDTYFGEEVGCLQGVGTAGMILTADIWDYGGSNDGIAAAGLGSNNLYTEPAQLPISGSLVATTPYIIKSQKASFSGYITGYTLTITSAVTGTIAPGLVLHCSGCAASGTLIVAGAGSSWTVQTPTAQAQTVGSSGSPVSMTVDIDYVLIVAASGTAGGTLPTLPFIFGQTFAYGGATLVFQSQWPYASLQVDGVNLTDSQGEANFYKLDESCLCTFGTRKTIVDGGAAFNYLHLDYVVGSAPSFYQYGGFDSIAHSHLVGVVTAPTYTGPLLLDSNPRFIGNNVSYIMGGSGIWNGNTMDSGIVFGPNVTNWGCHDDIIITSGTGITFSSGDDYIDCHHENLSGATTPSSGTSNLGVHSIYGPMVGDPVTVMPSAWRAVANSLASNVLLNNTSSYFDGPSVAPPSMTATICASGTVTVLDTAGIAQFGAKLWDGTTVIASTLAYGATTSAPTVIALSGCIVNPAGNLRISVNDASSTSGVIEYNTTDLGKDSTITAWRSN